MVWNERQISEIISAQQKLEEDQKRRSAIVSFLPLLTIIVALSLILMWLH